MGKIVSVWSQGRKSGRTVFLYNLASHMAEKLDEKFKILVCCANLAQGNLMHLFNIPENELNLEDIVNFKITSGGDINIFEAMARRDNVYFTGSRKTGGTYAARNISAYEELLRDFKGKFDLILIDILAGKENILTNMILQKSDFVLNVLCQDRESLDGSMFKTEKDLAYVVNYYRDIYPDTRDLNSLYKLDKPIFTLPPCDQLQEMKNKDKLALYRQHETKYNSSLKEITAFMAESLSLQLDAEPVGTGKKKGFLKSVIVNMLGEAYEQH